MKKIEFDMGDMGDLQSEVKVAIVATVNPDGQPHLSLLTSLRAKTATELTIGEFCKGISKENMQKNPQVAFVIMTMDRSLWRGKAQWKRLEREGEDYELYNDQPMFRYNAYFGVNTVHYLDLVETNEKEGLPLARIIPASLLTMAAKGGAKTGVREPILKPFAQNLFDKMDSLKFISYIGEDGFPEIIPLLQCHAADSRRLAFSPLAYRKELAAIRSGETVAVYCMTLDMQSTLVKGDFIGYDRYRGIRLGTIDINWVYNSMPPGHGLIYPRGEFMPVVDFE